MGDDDDDDDDDGADPGGVKCPGGVYIGGVGVSAGQPFVMRT